MHEQKLFWHSVLNIREIFSQVDIYSPMAVSKSDKVEKKSLPRVIPLYRCDETDAACLRRIENRIRAYPLVRLGHVSKDIGSRMRRHFVLLYYTIFL